MVRPHLLARYGLDGQLQGEQDAAKRFVALSQPRVDELGVAEYRLTVDVEGRAVLEAALGPLSAPRPTEGEPDLRSSDRRRGEALVARAVNASLGRWEAFWAPDTYSAVRLVSPTAIVEKAAYVLANPVEAGLVAAGSAWPGLWSAQERSGGEAFVVERP